MTRISYIEPDGVGECLPDMPLFLDPDYYVNVPLEQAYEQSWAGFPARWKQMVEAE